MSFATGFNQGTRSVSRTRTEHPPSLGETKSYTRDVGLSKNVTAAITFVASPTSQAQAAATTFANFAVNDQVLIEGTNQNNGIAVVTATNGSTYLTLDPPPKAEGPVTATIRSA